MSGGPAEIREVWVCVIGVTADIQGGHRKYKSQISLLKAEKIIRQSMFSRPNIYENCNRTFKAHANSFQYLAKLKYIQKSNKS